MRKIALVFAGAAITVIGAFGPASAAFARTTAPSASTLTGSITCASGTSGAINITPVDKNDMATGATLSLGCGQFSPGTASEQVSPGTVAYNYNGFYYPIGATATTSCGPNAANLGTSVTCSTTGAAITFNLVGPHHHRRHHHHDDDDDAGRLAAVRG
ncbi:MAG: hypothetical protein M0030_18055 [Actinomycetota bacterium]|nr:hypothetical protein [Actinomycetota bacterium]